MFSQHNVQHFELKDLVLLWTTDILGHSFFLPWIFLGQGCFLLRWTQVRS